MEVEIASVIKGYICIDIYVICILYYMCKRLKLDTINGSYIRI